MTQRMVTLIHDKLKGADGKPAVQRFVEESVEHWKRRGWHEDESQKNDNQDQGEGAERVPAPIEDTPVEQHPDADAPSGTENQS